jgi:hypothetical protein
MDILFLKKPDENRYSTSDHLEFHKTVCLICDRYAPQIQTPELIAEYKLKLDVEDNVFKWVRRSEFTTDKLEADNGRDDVLVGLTGVVRANLRNFDPSLRDNAKHVDNLLRSYGDLPHTDYDAETAGIDNLIKRLRSQEYAPAATNLGLTSWINELETRNNLFKSYVDDTTQEKINKPSVSSRTARHETDVALRQITDRVTSLINLNGPAGFTGFVEEFNTVTNHYNTLVHEHYGRLHAKTDISEAVIAPIDVQAFTGKPVYVIPTIFVKKTNRDGSTTTVELVFAQDFSVAYKNNVEPGTAILTINGIGKYTGTIVTTFNIG